MIVALMGLGFMQMSTAFADDANYPPSVQGGSAAVGGVKVGDSGLGESLAATGFNGTVLWAGIAVLLLGVALVAFSRRRSSHR